MKIKFEPRRELEYENCPYCFEYNKGGGKCQGCPMYEQGNGCLDRSINSTWRQAEKLWTVKATEEDKHELYALGRQYLEERGVWE